MNHCRPEEPSEDILQIQLDKNLNTKQALDKILPQVFPHLLKDSNLIMDPNTQNWVLAVTYGGTSALTFNSQKEYIDQTKIAHSLYLVRLTAAINLLPIQELRLSLSKPLYVKGESNPAVEIQEFEIYRTLVSISKVSEILQKHPEISPFGDKKKQKQALRSILEEVTKLWTVELNQLNLITIE